MYQKHSNTSKQAYMDLSIGSAGAKSAEKIYQAIYDTGLRGITSGNLKTKEGFEKLSITPRLIELERAGRIVRLRRTDKNPSGKQANVYIAKHYVPMLPYDDSVLPAKPAQRVPLTINQENRIKTLLRALDIQIDTGRPIQTNGTLHCKIRDALGIFE